VIRLIDGGNVVPIENHQPATNLKLPNAKMSMTLKSIEI